MDSGPILRFWTSSTGRHIRIEWTGGITAGQLHMRRSVADAWIHWTYDTPPDELALLALECAISGGEHDVPGAVWMGVERPDDMHAAVDAWGAMDALAQEAA